MESEKFKVDRERFGLQYIKPPSTVPEPQWGNQLRSGCSTSNPTDVPGKAIENSPSIYAPDNNLRDLDEDSGTRLCWIVQG